jgi:hypothetical protein
VLPDCRVDSVDQELKGGSVGLDVHTGVAARGLEEFPIAGIGDGYSASADHELRVVLAWQRVEDAARVST